MPSGEDIARGEQDREVRVREATADDARGVRTLAGKLAEAVGDTEPDPAAVRARLLELLDEPRAGVLVAEGGGDLLGVVSFWVKPDLAHGDTVVEVPMLAVAEAARRRGVGRLLMEAVRRTAAEEGAALIELVATRENAPARDFYRSLGFVETEHVALELVGNLQ